MMVFLPLQEVSPRCYRGKISLKLPKRRGQVIPAVEIETMGKLYSRCTSIGQSQCTGNDQLFFCLISFTERRLSYNTKLKFLFQYIAANYFEAR